jgi:hypothetical protein
MIKKKGRKMAQPEDEFVSVMTDSATHLVTLTFFSMDSTDTFFDRLLEMNCFRLVGKKDPVFTIVASTCQAVVKLWRRPQVVVLQAQGSEWLDEIKTWVISLMEEMGFKQRSGKTLAEDNV